jgi:hypothetical protein
MGEVAIATASPMIAVCGAPIGLAGIGTFALIGAVIFVLRAAAGLTRQRVRSRKG